jgi:predicted metal-dependent HD superfamily phosphohydrolase
MDFLAAEDYIIAKLKKELPQNLFYHSYGHVMDVLEASMMYADMEAVQDDERVLLKTAVLFHDSGFVVQSKNHEEIGCGIVREILPGFGFSEEQITRICGMIMATKIPQSPSNHLEQIICDADLDYLGREDFWEIGSNLFRELRAFGFLLDEQEWNRIQLKFLEEHKFFTPSAVSLRQQKKDEHTGRIRELVKSYN